LLIVHWKLPHDEALGTVRVWDDQMPRNEGPVGAPPPPAPSEGAGVGAATLLWCSKPHAPDQMAAAASAIYSGKALFIMDLIGLNSFRR
jgi:hypothetical protein